LSSDNRKIANRLFEQGKNCTLLKDGLLNCRKQYKFLTAAGLLYHSPVKSDSSPARKNFMEISFYLLLVLAHFGVFDVLYFHVYKCKLHLRPECHREVFWHVLRHLIYAAQFVWVANFRFHGWALLLLAALYFCDIFVAWSDVLEEIKAAPRRAVCRAASILCTSF
jgi:hypothetical protein